MMLLGWSLAAARGPVAPVLGAACLAVALLLQVAANLANDYFDARSGVDGADRLGPVRVTQSGLLAPRQVLAALLVCLAAAMLVGIWVAAQVGWWLLGLGAVCLIGAVAYTAGRRSLSRTGLGEVAALVFFGPVACTGSFVVLHGSTTAAAWLAGLIPGLHAAAIMAVNNLRDRASDARAGKVTMAVRLGDRPTRAVIVGLIVVGNLLAAPLAWLTGQPLVLVALALVPFGWPLQAAVWRTPVSPALNGVLARTGQWELISCVAVAVLLHL
jgi:1,4-dihydroxy-2-naphthoate octaprenyltransferase